MKNLAKLSVFLLICGPAASAQPLTKDQQRCIEDLNKGGAAVVKAQGKEELKCLKDAAKGKEPNAQACATGDAKGKVAKARAKLAAGEAKRCTAPLPPFGYADSTAVGDAAVAERTGLTSDVFGPDLGLAAVAKSVSKPDAACQAAVAKGVDKLSGALFGAATKAQKDLFRGKNGAPPETAEELSSALLAAVAGDAKGKIARATSKLTSNAEKKCSAADPAALFPGACAATGAAADLATCLEHVARCRFCYTLADFGTLDLACDDFDDTVANGSCPGTAIPAATVTATDPLEGATDVPPGDWIGIEFDMALPAESLAELILTCDGATPATRVDASAETVVYLIPDPALPMDAACSLALPGANASLSFATGATGPFVHYDPTDSTEIGAVPDDFLLVDDATTASGKRIELSPPEFEGLLGLVADGIAVSLAQRDGWSPLQPIVLGFSDAVDPATIPLDEVASLAADAAIRLFDIDPTSPTFGARVPFTGIVRSDATDGGTTDHQLILFPALNFRAGGRYGLVVTRDAATAATGAFAPSGFFDQVAAGAFAGTTDVERARDAVDPFLDFLEVEPAQPVAHADVALALSISIRTEFFDPTDWVSLKAAALAASSPTLSVDETEVLADETIHRGTLQVPIYLDESLTEVTRDAMTGDPLSLSTEDVPFVFRIPTNAPTPMPIVIYQHGSPGSPEEITGGSNSALIDAGYAMIGIQDLGNREFGQDTSAQTSAIIGRLAFVKALPLLEVQTHSDMFVLLRTIEGMGGAGNFPEIDPTRILFRGISFGAHHSLGFLPFAPEVTAAVSHVGSGRLYHPNLHQLDYMGLLDGILLALPGARPRDVIPGLALVQNPQDRDDTQLLARHLYLDPLVVPGQLDTTPPSLLWIEGIGDSLVPNTATRAAAVELGIPTVRPVPGPSPVLTEVDAPVSENIAPGVTAGHFQYDPAQTQSCIDSNETEGHFCAQGADEVVDQMLHFFDTALSGTAEIVDPF
ncbi:MAG: hypothetical protein OEP95_06410 [Myxococcales bacterium]|nr:hypothetical protein [Myxococcales bacterium]